MDSNHRTASRITSKNVIPRILHVWFTFCKLSTLVTPKQSWLANECLRNMFVSYQGYFKKISLNISSICDEKRLISLFGDFFLVNFSPSSVLRLIDFVRDFMFDLKITLSARFRICADIISAKVDSFDLCRISDRYFQETVITDIFRFTPKTWKSLSKWYML